MKSLTQQISILGAVKRPFTIDLSRLDGSYLS